MQKESWIQSLQALLLILEVPLVIKMPITIKLREQKIDQDAIIEELYCAKNFE
jgi:hypothetical protein